MGYCLARYEQEQERKAYRIYVTDALRVIGENTARYAGGGYIAERFADVLDRKPPDRRSLEEITAEIVARCGLVVKDESI